MKYFVLAAVILPTLALAQETKIDKLVVEYQQRGVVQVQPNDPHAEIRRLKNELIDLRVERDLLQGQVRYLEQEAQRVKVNNKDCTNKTQCIPLEQVQKDKIVTHIVYSLSLYRLAEALNKSAPTTDVEAHKRAQRVMKSALEDLESLGFDTKNPANFPTVEELMKQLDTQAIGANRR